MADSAHPAATHHMPSFITAPGETDVLMVVMSVFLVLAILGFGIFFLRLHTLPERMAHKAHKIQFEIVAVLGLIALFTHMHIFWVAGLLLALIDFPDFGNSLSRIAGSAEKMAGFKPGEGAVELPEETIAHGHDAAVTPSDTDYGARQSDGAATVVPKPVPAKRKELGHA
jgi:hypothetical protein